MNTGATRSALHDELARDHLVSTLKAGRPVSFRVRGGSMEPWIHDGDIVEVEPDSVLEKGDVALVEDARILRVHRVIDAGTDGIRTAGDRLKRADPPAAWKRVLGRVKRVTRNGRTVHLALHPAIGRVWAALFPLRPRLFPILRTIKRLAQA
ncbi:MAG: S24/S26 family peptidase [Nitrospirae bacterium]|nr:S24/S26 family peptidase [Nitrospirota bacterium]